MSANVKKVGLALGSGGWRGLAHIGVIKVLEKNGISIDYITGSSVGALVGGLYAYYGNVTELEQIIENIGYFDLLRAVSDPKANLGLIKGIKIVEFLETFLHGAKIEDLKIPFKAATTDILNGATVYLDKGSLATAIRASISVPLIFAPVDVEGKKLVDGANSAPVPTEEVRRMGADVVIGVNLYGNIFPMTAAMEGQTKLNAKEVFTASIQMLLNQMAKENLRWADVALTPKIPEKNFNIFKNFVKEKGTVLAGEESREEEMGKLRGLLENS
jgi:NTE family protein